MASGKFLRDFWMDILSSQEKLEAVPWLYKKYQLHKKNGYRIVRISGQVQPYHRIHSRDKSTNWNYHLKMYFVIRKKQDIYVEEAEIDCQAIWKNGKLLTHEFREEKTEEIHDEVKYEPIPLERAGSLRFTYDRRSAVRYAERWWDSYNPAYRHFTNDCTNFISQCLRAGGVPMWGAPNRGKGWWYNDRSWSYSWAVAHAFRWYLSGARQGLKVQEMDSPKDLIPGDVICYDFEGDGRWNHNTIVVMKNSEGMPLVNAHTTNSRHRYWSYEDSTAYTPNIKYKFFRIGG
ncbi:amidase domain-containing protein [Thalassobacillus pellis]|uniref:amidase domain-containing protein n=1 Tax=Thalassobacillus pellis TaxID=748008 RepID=UPI001EF8EF60|nr:amidase domain-containing protein [Thalassobacillus pellis]MBM7551228.1 hypothetical protein [Thalassobacillus pellis]